VRTIIASTLAWAACLPAGAGTGEDARLLRFADIHGDRVAFVHAGDLWTAPAGGGTAARLTTDPGLELFPKFSPDGRHIAFSAEYGGNRQVWVIPTEGGTPRQLTFYNDVGALPPRGGFDYQVLDWTPDGQEILFRANRLPWSERMGRPYLVPLAGGTERPLPVPESGGGMFSPDGKKLVYTPIERESRTWKRYRGGRAQDVWIFDLERIAAERITDFEGTDNQPLWVGEAIYFTSDRDRRLNLYRYDPATRATRKVTHHEDFDVLWPSAGPREIVYECGGYLYRFDPATERSERIPVRIGGDFAAALPHYENVARRIDGADLSPSGKRALFEARGDLFTVPAEHGEVRNLTATPGIRELDPVWSPDGRQVAYLGDRSGEYEIYVRPADGTGQERQVTAGGGTWLFPPVWSPDGKRLAFADTRARLRWVDVAGGRITDVDTGTHGNISGYGFSPDGRFLVYAKPGETRRGSLWVHALETGRTSRLTDGTTNDYAPVFDPGGRYLYFLSDRDYDLTFSGYEFNYLYANPTRVYAATLKADGPALLAPRSDEEPAGDGKAEDKKDTESEKEQQKTKDQKPEPAPVVIDVEGFASRVVALPGGPGNHRALRATDKGAFYLVDEDGKPKLKLFSFEDEKTEVVLEGVASYVLSRDGKKLLYRQGDTWGIADARAGQKAGDGKLALGGMELRIEPRQEWKQIFADAWRLLRDWFYDEGMHGLDWPAMRRLYEPLVDHVDHRADLDYILGELGGELNAGHVYVEWGDMPRPERVDNGLLGAEIEPHASGYFRIARIFPGENWAPDFRSPLTAAGVNAKPGEFILAVGGRSTRGVANFYSLLENAAGRVVELRINDRPDEQGARTVRVRPVARETGLRYLDWVRSRAELVDRLSGGRIGYVHLPNTAVEGNRELAKHFLPQAHKDALIVDVRYNGGGFIPDRMIELLARTRLSFWARRGIEPFQTPGYAHDGPKACLINGYSSSGGDAFPYYFRKLGLGPLIGTRTWGGLIGLSGNPGFVDGGSINIPTFRFLDTAGRWAVENEGVAPDIEVVDRPDLVAAGHDPSLERAVEVLLDELKRHPPRRPEPPEPPRYER